MEMALDLDGTISDIYLGTEVWDQESDEEHSVECLEEKPYLNKEWQGEMLRVKYIVQIEQLIMITQSRENVIVMKVNETLGNFPMGAQDW